MDSIAQAPIMVTISLNKAQWKGTISWAWLWGQQALLKVTWGHGEGESQKGVTVPEVKAWGTAFPHPRFWLSAIRK